MHGAATVRALLTTRTYEYGYRTVLVLVLYVDVAVARRAVHTVRIIRREGRKGSTHC